MARNSLACVGDLGGRLDNEVAALVTDEAGTLVVDVQTNRGILGFIRLARMMRRLPPHGSSKFLMEGQTDVPCQIRLKSRPIAEFNRRAPSVFWLNLAGLGCWPLRLHVGNFLRAWFS